MVKRRETGGKTKSGISTRNIARESTVESRRRKRSSIDRVDKSTKKRKEERKHYIINKYHIKRIYVVTQV